MTQQDTKREKGTRKEGRKGGHKGRRTSPLAKVGRSREGFTLFWGLRDPRCHFLAATWKLAEKTERLTKFRTGGMRAGSWPGGRRWGGDSELRLPLRATGQEVRVEAEISLTGS